MIDNCNISLTMNESKESAQMHPMKGARSKVMVNWQNSEIKPLPKMHSLNQIRHSLALKSIKAHDHSHPILIDPLNVMPNQIAHHNIINNSIGDSNDGHRNEQYNDYPEIPEIPLDLSPKKQLKSLFNIIETAKVQNHNNHIINSRDDSINTNDVKVKVQIHNNDADLNSDKIIKIENYGFNYKIEVTHYDESDDCAKKKCKDTDNCKRMKQKKTVVKRLNEESDDTNNANYDNHSDGKEKVKKPKLKNDQINRKLFKKNKDIINDDNLKAPQKPNELLNDNKVHLKSPQKRNVFPNNRMKIKLFDNSTKIQNRINGDDVKSPQKTPKNNKISPKKSPKRSFEYKTEKMSNFLGKFEEFTKTRFSSMNKNNEPFLQRGACLQVAPKLPLCHECRMTEMQNDKRKDMQICRFYNYRMLISKDNVLSLWGFYDKTFAEPEDNEVWLPGKRERNSLDISSSKLLLKYVGDHFCGIIQQEFNTFKHNDTAIVTWKKPIEGIRELCDVCQTTVFNTHWVCPECGFLVCIDCYQFRKYNNINRNDETRYHLRCHDEYQWLFCNNKQIHDPNKFQIAHFIVQSAMFSLNQTLHTFRNMFKISSNCTCDLNSPMKGSSLTVQSNDCVQFSAQQLSQQFTDVPHSWFCDERLLVLHDPRHVKNINLFEAHWIHGQPVMVQNVHHSLKHDLWHPKAFNRDFGHKRNPLINCMNGNILKKMPMSVFWNGFEDVAQRLLDEDNKEMLLKLKDWPPNAEFRELLPSRFHDLMNSLPLPEYTRFDGKLNLSSRLPKFFVRPDLGPKMYCAYGSVMHPSKGTTNLHLDMSDAINVMIYVGIAKNGDKDIEECLREAIIAVDSAGCDDMMKNRVREIGAKVGALWHIFAPNDADKIRKFLINCAIERGDTIEENTDPIHDQDWYLDETLRERLLQEYGVKGYAIAQCLGDAVLIPAGAPHQVRNLHSCIKVAGEFVSPQNVGHCLTLTHEFRQLSQRHLNHEDKLQIKNIVYHTVKDAISCLYTVDLFK